jgi:glycine/D-amino acid oxidase-like deaminating enzyme
MCRGRVIELCPPPGTSPDAPPVIFPPTSPSLLGPAWISAQGSGTLLVGATKDWENGDLVAEVPPKEGEEVAEVLLAKAETIYPPVRDWRVVRVRSGVRAWAKRTSEGTLPIAGKLQSRGASEGAISDPPESRGSDMTESKCRENGGFGRESSGRLVSQLRLGDDCAGQESRLRQSSIWVVGGLGARGLVYHAWLAEKAAAAIVHDDESLLPSVLRRWQAGFVEAVRAERKPRVRMRLVRLPVVPPTKEREADEP